MAVLLEAKLRMIKRISEREIKGDGEGGRL